MEFSFSTPAWRMILVRTVVGIAKRPHQVAKEVTRAHWRQLVVIADKNHGGARAIHCLEQPPGERDIHHRNFVHDEDVRFNRVQRIPRIRVAVEAEQPMDRACVVADHFLEAFGSLAGGRGQHDLGFR